MRTRSTLPAHVNARQHSTRPGTARQQLDINHHAYIMPGSTLADAPPCPHAAQQPPQPA